MDWNSFFSGLFGFFAFLFFGGVTFHSGGKTEEGKRKYHFLMFATLFFILAASNAKLATIVDILSKK